MAKIPAEITSRIERGRKRKIEHDPERSLAIEFYRGNQYLFEQDGKLYDQRGYARSQGNQRDRHRVRQVRNHIAPIVDEKVSAATSRVPAYETLPASTDHEDIAAAALAEKILLGGYVTWGVEAGIRAAVWYALVVGEGFVYPYWDGNVGPFIETEEGVLGLGEIKIRAFGGGEAFWEPGTRFEDSRWHVIENARPISELRDEPGFIGGDLKADAKARKVVGSGTTSKASGGTDLVITTEYFERPCPKYPEGRHLTIANDRLIFKEAVFPLRDETGAVIDEPPFLRLSYSIDPDADRDTGIVEPMVDPQRSLNDGENKIHEWINLALAPQIMAPRGAITTRPTAEPGDILEYNLIPGMDAPKWRESPSVPRELFEIKDRAELDMRAFAHSDAINSSSISSGSEAREIITAQQMADAAFLSSLAGVYGATGRRCLALAQRFYSEPRLLRYRGRVGWEDTGDFTGADIHGQTDVRVSVNSIEPRTKRSMEQKITNLAQMFPGYFTPEVIMSAMEGGNAEKLIDTYELDVQRVASVIKKIRAGVLLMEPNRPTFPNEEFPNPDAVAEVTIEQQVDPMGQIQMIEVPTGNYVSATTGEPTSQFLSEVPGWMPRPFDGVPIHKATIEDWLKTSDYDNLAPDQKEQAHIYYSALLDLESRAAERAAQQQALMAEQLGAENATRPPSKQMGSMPALPA